MTTVAAHHDLCFGCGAANVFGLHLEPASRDGVGGGAVDARFFVKQDHQGPDGALHDGVLAAALLEAMALAGGGDDERGPARGCALELRARPPVGTFVRVTARRLDGGGVTAEATGDDGGVLATARAGATDDEPEERWHRA